MDFELGGKEGKVWASLAGHDVVWGLGMRGVYVPESWLFGGVGMDVGEWLASLGCWPGRGFLDCGAGPAGVVTWGLLCFPVWEEQRIR